MSGIDHHARLAMARAWPLLAGLVEQVSKLVGLADGVMPERIGRIARLEALRLIRPAEALVRRLIVLMAREMLAEIRHGERSRTTAKQDGAALSLLHVSRLAAIRAQSRNAPKQAAHFRFFEPIPSFRMFDAPPDANPAASGPRILGLDTPQQTETTTENPRGPARLIARIQALQAILDAPDKRAKRHARFLVRQSQPSPPHPKPVERRGGTGLRHRTNPCRPGHPPGSRSRYTPPWLTGMLVHLAREIRRLPPWRPSPADVSKPTNENPRHRAGTIIMPERRMREA